MKHYLRLAALSAVICALSGGQAIASELVYTPVNPNFGGNPFNAAPLQSSAEAQKQFVNDGGGFALPDFSGLEDAIIDLGDPPDPPDPPAP